MKDRDATFFCFACVVCCSNTLSLSCSNMSTVHDHLFHEGWAWLPTPESFRDFCDVLYHGMELVAVQQTIPPCVGPSIYAMGNPVEYMVFLNHMESVPLYCHRVWWLPLSAGEEIILLRRSHDATFAHPFLATGRALPLSWDAGPQSMQNVPIDKAVYAAYAVQVHAVAASGVVVLDNMLIASPIHGTVGWTSWQPVQWSSSSGCSTVVIPERSTPCKGHTDWWGQLRQLRSSILTCCMQHGGSSLCMFDDMLLVNKETVLHSMHSCGLHERTLSTFFQTMDGGHYRLRTEPPTSGVHEEDEANHGGPPSTLEVSCPRGSLLHRMCIEEGLYSPQDIMIRGFDSMDVLQLPFGRPQWNEHRKQESIGIAACSRHHIVAEHPATSDLFPRITVNNAMGAQRYAFAGHRAHGVISFNWVCM